MILVDVLTQFPEVTVKEIVWFPELPQETEYGPAPLPLIIVPVPKFQAKVVPTGNGPAAEIVFPTLRHPVSGAVIAELGGVVTVTFVVAGADEQPPLVIIRLAVEVPGVDQLTETGPAEVEVAGVEPGPKLQA